MDGTLGTTPTPPRAAPSSVDDLSDGPLGHALLYLSSLDHLLSAGLTCRRWQSILTKQVSSFSWPLHRRDRATDAALTCVVSHRFRHLTALDLACCRGLSDAGARVVALLCPRLRLLDLTHCKLITDAGIAAVSSCGSLEGRIDNRKR